MGNVIAFILLAALLIWIIPACIVWAWGLFVPALFGLPYITWTQAFGMWLLFGCLFGGHSAKFNKD